jgi:prefoldin subunit 5
MTDMERRRLQLYAKSAKLQQIRRKIDVLEEILGPLYREAEEWERTFTTVNTRVPTKRSRRR